MTFTDRLKRLILRMSRIRIVSKKKMDERKLQNACNKEALALDELKVLSLLDIQPQMTGFGTDGASSSHGTYAESIRPRFSIDSFGIGSFKSVEDPDSETTKEDIDFRFIMNPIGIGSSRSFEKPSPDDTQTTEMVPSEIISRGFKRLSFGCGNAGDDDRQSASGPQEIVSELSTRIGPGSLRIQETEGKGKGKASEAEIEEARMMRYWLTQIERGNLVPQDEATREFVAFVRGRAWTL